MTVAGVIIECSQSVWGKRVEIGDIEYCIAHPLAATQFIGQRPMRLRAIQVLLAYGALGMARIRETERSVRVGGQPKRFALVAHRIKVWADCLIGAGAHAAQAVDTNWTFADMYPRRGGRFMHVVACG